MTYASVSSLPRESLAFGARSSSLPDDLPRCGRFPIGVAGRLELEAGIAEARLAEPSFAPEHADELLVVASFLKRPGPELRVVPLDAEEILAA